MNHAAPTETDAADARATESTALKPASIPESASSSALACWRPSQMWLGIIYAWLAVHCVAFEPVFVRMMQDRAMSIGPYLFWSCIGKGMVVVIYSAVSASTREPAHHGKLPIVGYCGGDWAQSRTGMVCALVAWLAGLGNAPIAGWGMAITSAVEAYATFYVYPLWTALFVACVLRVERVKTYTWVVLVVVTGCLVTMLVDAVVALPKPSEKQVLDPGSMHAANWLGDSMCLIGSVLFGAYMATVKFVSISHGPERHTPIQTMLGLGIASGGVIVGVPVMIVTGTTPLTGVTPLNALVMLGGLWLLGGAYYPLVSLAVQRCSATSVALIMMTDMAIAPTVSYFFYDEALSMAAIICLVVIVVVIGGHEVYKVMFDSSET